MRRELIVRLSGRGQYELTADNETLLVELNELDNEIVALLTQTESRIQQLLEQMAARVEAHGQLLDDALASSDLILPPADLTLAEAAELFKGEGIVPG
jgi:hypothetical protein